jgi:hypothetical protein
VASHDELIQTFGATSMDTVIVQGRWLYQSIVYSDQLIRLRLDVEDTPENRDTMRQIKEVLKARFEQIDIYITAHRIEII